ncbi:MAG: hypothetical protein HKM06_01200 [Spirochaetales bacterium]|nr:hypothetical protein [Spirochaetales bacterium]
MKTHYRQIFFFLMASLTVLFFMTDCRSATGTAITPVSQVSVRALPSDFFTRKAIAYEGYRTTSSPGSGSGVPTAANVDQDLTLLKQAGYSLLRVFSSNTDGLTPLVLQEIQNLGYDMKVQLGIWISGPKSTSDAANQVEIAEGIKLANQYPAIVEGVSVGNETMVNWSGLKVPVADMVGYITQVRSAIAQPVTTDDNWAFWADSNGASNGGPGTGSYDTAAILASVDYISMHSYAFSDAPYNLYDWQQSSASATASGSSPSPRATAMMNAAFVDEQANFNAVQSYAASEGHGSLPIIIGETGWKAVATNSSVAAEQYMAHPVNQQMFLSLLNSWTTGPKNIFYFEAFDEPWKGGDDGWGLFDVNRYARYSLYSVFPAASTTTVTNNGNSETIQIPGNESLAAGGGLTYTGANAVCYTAPVTNATITTNEYLVYADSVVASTGVSVPNPLPLSWNAWNTPATASGSEITAVAPDTAAEGTKYYSIQPTPGVNNPAWGWGYFLNLNNSDDLSNFASGHLHFSVRTTYQGKLEFGFFTGSAASNTAVQAILPVDPSSNTYGYVNNGSWCNVSIPISAISAVATPAYGQPSTAKLNLAQVAQPFLMADLYASTGNTATLNGTSNPKIAVDDIYWTQN